MTLAKGYEPYGEVLDTAGSASTAYGFTGEWTDNTGLAHYALLRWMGGLIWRGDQVTSILFLTIAILPSYPIFALFYGLFGGWDDATPDEVRRAAELSTFMKPLAWLFWKSTALGASIIPLHNRFPITNRQAALAEANSLTRERVNL